MLSFFFLPPVLILLIGLFSGQLSLAADFCRVTLIAFLFVISFAGWGSLVFRNNSRSNILEFWFVRLLGGAGMLYAAFIFIAWLHFYRPVLIIPLIATGAVIGLLRVFAERPNLLFSGWPKIDRAFLSGIALLAGIRIVCSWTPLISYDSLVYQFYTPAQYLSHSGFIYIPWNVYTNSPMALQLTLGSSLSLDPSGAAFKTLITLMSLSMPVAVGLFLNEWNRTAALIASLFALTYPAFWMPDTLGTIDLAAAGFLVYGVYALRKNEAVVAGISCGFALASRYQTIILLLLALIFLAIEKLLHPKQLRGIFICALTALFFAAPWLIKNWIYTGNPFFPALYGWLGGSDWSLDQARRLNFDVFGAPLSAFQGTRKLTAPLSLLLVQPYNAVLGIPLLLSGAISLLMYSKRIYWLSALLGLTGVLAWGLLHPVADVRLFRFNAGALLFLMIALAGFCVDQAKRAGIIMAVLLASGSLAFALASLSRVFPVYKTVTSEAFRRNFRLANMPSLPLIEKANTLLDPGKDKILLLGETRGFLVHVPCACPSAFNSPQVAALFRPLDLPDSWTTNFKRGGISHILISSIEWQNLQNMKYYGYMNFATGDRLKILRWLQAQKLVYQDHSGNALLEIRNDKH